MFETHFEALSARYEELLLSSHQNEVIPWVGIQEQAYMMRQES